MPFKVINNYDQPSAPCCYFGCGSSRDLRRQSANHWPAYRKQQVYILDEDLQRVPVHVAGEIYVGGKGVARGYLNQPDLTAEKFIANPFADDQSARDSIEPATWLAIFAAARLLISAASTNRSKSWVTASSRTKLSASSIAIPTFRPAVSSLTDQTCREKHLVAYVVLKPEAPPAASVLRSFLEKELPQFMIPSVFVRLDALPLTQNGKVDRAALPAPTPENTLRDEVFTAARTPVEERLATMLTALLGLDQVSVHDNFFMLGGHSLLGTQLISQIRGAFGVELALRKLFEAPTIEQLSLEIEALVMARVEAMSEDEVQVLLAQ